MEETNAAGLETWAVDCDALARGEQIFQLRPAPRERSFRLRHEEFWLVPDWQSQEPQLLVEPYRDRLRALDAFRHDDRRVRIQYYATIEYRERLGLPARLRTLDGEHTLNMGAVRSLFDTPDGEDVGEELPVSLLILRVYRRPEAVVLEPEEILPDETRAGSWVRLPEPLSTSELEPVLDDDRFLAEKARILQRTDSIRAM